MTERHVAEDAATDPRFRIADLEDENMVLRRLLWLRHGCSIDALYGDDGEMQCGICLIDFKREPATWFEEFWSRQQWPK